MVSVLQSGLALTHPFVIGELACGQLKSRAEILGLLAALPQAQVSQEQEVLFFIERRGARGLAITHTRRPITLPPPAAGSPPDSRPVLPE